MKCGSLFSGVGGMDLGLARAGFTHEFFCEADPFRRQILARHWPGVRIFSDVREIDAAVIERPRDSGGRNDRESGIDLLAGGFPCQDLSVAGNRKGLAGNRSGLFFEFARIADAFRPEWILLENVPGLFSSNGGRDFGVVLGTLADLGYGLGWRTLDSRYFGVPQRRRRVFILGNLLGGSAGAERCAEVLSLGQSCERHSQKGREAGQGTPAGFGASPVEPGGGGHQSKPHDLQ